MRGPPDAAKIPLPLNPGCAPEFPCLLRASRQRCDFFYTWSWDAFREQDLLLFIYYYRPPIVYSNKQVRIRKHDKRKTTLCQGSVFFHCCLVQKLDHLTCKCLVMMLLYNMYKPFLELHSGLFSELRYKNVMSNGLILLMLNGILLNFQGCCQKTR